MPTIAEAFAIAAVHFHAGRLQDAEHICGQILAAAPLQPGALNLLGVIHARRGELQAGVQCFQRAVAAHPNWAEPHGNLGLALKDQGKLDEAEAILHRALELQPDFVEAHNTLGAIHKARGNPHQAVACFHRAWQLAPDAVGILGDLVHQLEQLCLWDDLPALTGRLLDLASRGGVGEASPFAMLALASATNAAQQLHFARCWADAETRAARASGGAWAFLQSHAPKSKITIGYLSGDFHSHATARLIVELFEKHDRIRFAVHGYSYGPDDGSLMRRRVVAAFDQFVDLRNATSVDAARRIAADDVDILIDLKGYTAHARTPILVHRPAPIQVNFLGYPGTMGADFIDYILVDDFIVPPDQQPFFSERLVHLPGCYQVNDSRREIAPRTPSRAECGLPTDGFVFCSFNDNYKVTPAVFDVWMRLLAAVPGSVLWLLEGNCFAPANLRREAERRGIEPERLIFAPRMGLAEHLGRHPVADLFLDTFPVNAHTTASDALWAGCPLLTLTGETFVSRVAGSLLRAIGLPELIATSLAEYEAIALRLAREPPALAALRSRLTENRATSSLFDAERFARNIERAFVTMWEIHKSGEKPRPFAVR
jgi:protein O-GlcNAc transferase